MGNSSKTPPLFHSEHNRIFRRHHYVCKVNVHVMGNKVITGSWEHKLDEHPTIGDTIFLHATKKDGAYVAGTIVGVSLVDVAERDHMRYPNRDYFQFTFLIDRSLEETPWEGADHARSWYGVGEKPGLGKWNDRADYAVSNARKEAEGTLDTMDRAFDNRIKRLPGDHRGQ